MRDQSETGQAAGQATAASASDSEWCQVTRVSLSRIYGGQIDAKGRLDPVVVLGGRKTGYTQRRLSEGATYGVFCSNAVLGKSLSYMDFERLEISRCNFF